MDQPGERKLPSGARTLKAPRGSRKDRNSKPYERQGFFSRLTSSFASYFRGENDANTNDVEEEIDNVELENPSATSHVAPDVQLEDKSTSTETDNGIAETGLAVTVPAGPRVAVQQAEESALLSDVLATERANGGSRRQHATIFDESAVQDSYLFTPAAASRSQNSSRIMYDQPMAFSPPSMLHVPNESVNSFARQQQQRREFSSPFYSGRTTFGGNSSFQKPPPARKRPHTSVTSPTSPPRQPPSKLQFHAREAAGPKLLEVSSTAKHILSILDKTAKKPHQNSQVASAISSRSPLSFPEAGWRGSSASPNALPTRSIGLVKQSLAGPPVDDIQYAVPAGRSQPVAVSHARRPKASSSMLASGMNGDSPQGDASDLKSVRFADQNSFSMGLNQGNSLGQRNATRGAGLFGFLKSHQFPEVSSASSETSTPAPPSSGRSSSVLPSESGRQQASASSGLSGLMHSQPLASRPKSDQSLGNSPSLFRHTSSNDTKATPSTPSLASSSRNGSSLGSSPESSDSHSSASSSSFASGSTPTNNTDPLFQFAAPAAKSAPGLSRAKKVPRDSQIHYEFSTPSPSKKSSRSVLRNEVSSSPEEDIRKPTSVMADSAATQPSLKDMFAAKRSAEWSCTTCMSSNSLDKDKCVACGGAKPSASTAKLSTSSSLFGSATITAAVASCSKASDQPSLSSLFGKKANEWTCSSCSLTNDTSKTNCVACNTAKPGADSTAVDRPLSSSTSAAEASSSSDASKPASLASMFASKTSGQWKCDTCMSPNDSDKAACVACGGKKPGSSSAAATVASGSASSSSQPSLTAMFASKKPAGQWKCDTCMSPNDSDKAACVACNAPKPGAGTSTSAAPSLASTGGMTFGPSGGLKMGDGGLKLGSSGGLKMGDGGLKLGSSGGLKMGDGGLQLGSSGGLKMGDGGLKLGSSGGLKMGDGGLQLGSSGGLKMGDGGLKLGSSGGLKMGDGGLKLGDGGLKLGETSASGLRLSGDVKLGGAASQAPASSAPTSGLNESSNATVQSVGDSTAKTVADSSVDSEASKPSSSALGVGLKMPTGLAATGLKLGAGSGLQLGSAIGGTSSDNTPKLSGFGGPSGSITLGVAQSSTDVAPKAKSLGDLAASGGLSVAAALREAKQASTTSGMFSGLGTGVATEKSAPTNEVSGSSSLFKFGSTGATATVSVPSFIVGASKPSDTSVASTALAASSTTGDATGGAPNKMFNFSAGVAGASPSLGISGSTATKSPGKPAANPGMFQMGGATLSSGAAPVSTLPGSDASTMPAAGGMFNFSASGAADKPKTKATAAAPFQFSAAKPDSSSGGTAAAGPTGAAAPFQFSAGATGAAKAAEASASNTSGGMFNFTAGSTVGPPSTLFQVPGRVATASATTAAGTTGTSLFQFSGGAAAAPSVPAGATTSASPAPFTFSAGTGSSITSSVLGGATGSGTGFNFNAAAPSAVATAPGAPNTGMFAFSGNPVAAPAAAAPAAGGSTGFPFNSGVAAASSGAGGTSAPFQFGVGTGGSNAPAGGSAPFQFGAAAPAPAAAPAGGLVGAPNFQFAAGGSSTVPGNPAAGSMFGFSGVGATPAGGLQQPALAPPNVTTPSGGVQQQVAMAFSAGTGPAGRPFRRAMRRKK